MEKQPISISIPTRKPTSPNPPMNNSNINNFTQGNKSYLHFLTKPLFFLVLLILLPLFPSNPPDVFSDTILDKFWELIHLLFIGIVVSYGLFSTRNNAEMVSSSVVVENSSSSVDNLESYYMPRMFDGFDNDKGYGQSKSRLLLECGDGDDENDRNVVATQAWNSKYFQGESMVFVAQPECGVGEIVRPKSVFDDAPLGLPIRSLKSSVKNKDKCEFGDRSETSFGSNDSCEWRRDRTHRSYDDLAPINLLEKFNQAMDSSSSPIHQRSSSRKMERGKRVGNATRGPAHFRPMSVDEGQFESLQTQSFRSTLSFSSRTSSKSSSPENEYASGGSISSEVMNSETVHLGKRKKSSRPSLPSGQQSEPIPMNEKASTGGWNSRGYSVGSVSEEESKKSSDNYLKKELSGNLSRGDRYDSGKKEFGTWTFGSEKKPTILTKSSSRGKSVRTIRGSSRLTTPNTVEDNQKIFDNAEAAFMRKEKMANGRIDNLFDMPKQLAFPKYQKEQQMQDFIEYVDDVPSEEESESEAENFEVSSKDRVEATAAGGNVVAGPDSEVDKKASEFIAKFREQIRLQKVSSVDRSRGLSLASQNRFRTLSVSFPPSTRFSYDIQIIQCCTSDNSRLHRAESGGISHFEDNLNRRVVVFLSVTTTLFPSLSSSAKTKNKSPYDERRLLEQNKRIQKENNLLFEEGIRDMKPGGKRRIIIPPELGPPVGPSTFFSSKQFEVFDVELLSIQNCVRRTIAGFYSDFVCE